MYWFGVYEYLMHSDGNYYFITYYSFMLFEPPAYFY